MRIILTQAELTAMITSTSISFKNVLSTNDSLTPNLKYLVLRNSRKNEEWDSFQRERLATSCREHGVGLVREQLCWHGAHISEREIIVEVLGSGEIPRFHYRCWPDSFSLAKFHYK